MKRLAAVFAALMLVCAGALAEDNWLAGVLGGMQQETRESVALLTVEGELFASDYWYDHAGTLDAIDAAACDGENQALLLVLNTPGGSLYEADELYHALLAYKADTGRPVYGYMAQECCSAGVMAAMGADYLAASRMTVTGNVGVYMESYSEAGLYEKLGVERVYVATGENKVFGYPTLTDAQREIHQALVDECFAFFCQAIRDARGLDDAQMAGFLDGRLLSAQQAKDAGLIDAICYYDEMLAYVQARHPGAELVDVTPEWTDAMESADGAGLLDWMDKLEDGGRESAGARRGHAIRGI